MRLLIKVCGFTEVASVQAAAAAGVDAVGFVFADSPRNIEPKCAALLASSLPSDILTVAVMRHPSNKEWRAILGELQPDVLQTDAEDYAELDIPAQVQRWPVFREGGSAPGDCSRFVYEGKNSGRGERVDWSGAAQLANDKEMILAGGLSSANVAAAISRVQPFGVDVSSGVESAPGKKDAQRIAEFINAARAAEKYL